MKKLLALAALIGINGLVHATTITYPTSGANFLEGDYAYAWGISIAVPNGQSVNSATLNFNNITLTTAGTYNMIYADLLNLGSAGLTTKTGAGDTSYDYWTTQYSGANLVSLGSQSFTLNQTKSWSYTLTTSQLASVNNFLTASNGVFNIGIDPNCYYSDSNPAGSITFSYTLGTTASSVPDGASTALLLGASLAGLEMLRRQIKRKA